LDPLWAEHHVIDSARVEPLPVDLDPQSPSETNQGIRVGSTCFSRFAPHLPGSHSRGLCSLHQPNRRHRRTHSAISPPPSSDPLPDPSGQLLLQFPLPLPGLIPVHPPRRRCHLLFRTQTDRDVITEAAQLVVITTRLELALHPAHLRPPPPELPE